MSSASNGPIRLSGLISGFDTQSIVEQILAVDQKRIDDLKEDKDLNKAKIDTWEDMQDQLQSLASSINTLRADGTTGNTLYDDKAVSSSSESTATATAATAAASANYNVVVTTLAQAEVAYGNQKPGGYTLPAAGTVTLNGATINFSGGETLQELANIINAASYPSGEDLIASVVDDRMVLQSETGVSKSIYGTTPGAPDFVAGDDPNDILDGELGLIDGTFNLAFTAQTALDAAFSVNGIAITRESNTFDDVIENVTVTLAQAGTTELAVKVNSEPIKESVRDFVEIYNETRDFITRIRSAKLDEDEQFGLFFSDPLLRGLFNEMRELTTSGVQMGDADWDGSPTPNASPAGATSITLNGFTNATGTLQEGDQFIIDGDSTIYTLANSTTITANSATVSIEPPLTQATVGGELTRVAIRTLEDIGVGTRTDQFSGIEGVIGVLDEGLLDSQLSTDLALVRRLFTRISSEEGSTGVARRMHDWLDTQTKVTVFSSSTRSIDDVKIPSLEDDNERLDEQIKRLEQRLTQKEATLIRQFSEMERAMSEANASGSALQGLAAGGGGGQ